MAVELDCAHGITKCAVSHQLRHARIEQAELRIFSAVPYVYTRRQGIHQTIQEMSEEGHRAQKTGVLERTSEPRTLADVPTPEPREREILIKVSACGICHTELDEIEGRTSPPCLPIVLGHEVVGRVVQLGPDASKHSVGQRVGVGWIHSSTGRSDENQDERLKATGRDANGGCAVSGITKIAWK